MPYPSSPTTPVVVVSGNPRAGSRTLTTAQALASRLAARLDVGPTAPSGSRVLDTIELADLAAEILTPHHPRADVARQHLTQAALAVVATPVYKASYTGLLKAFLDLYGPDGLAGVVVVPVVVSGSPAHALAGEVHLRPVLVELGAVVPTRTFAVTEGQLDRLDDVADAWVEQNVEVLRRALGVGLGLAAARGDGPDEAASAPGRDGAAARAAGPDEAAPAAGLHGAAAAGELAGAAR